MSIRKQGRQWEVTNRAGTRVLGRHATKAEAQAQLRAIEAAKAARASGLRGGRRR